MKQKADPLPHLLLGFGSFVLGSSPFAGPLSQLSAASSSSGCCTSRWMWQGEEGRGDVAEEPWEGESGEVDEEEEPLL